MMEVPELRKPPKRPERFRKRFGFGLNVPKTGKKRIGNVSVCLRFFPRAGTTETYWKRIGTVLETYFLKTLKKRRNDGNVLET